MSASRHRSRFVALAGALAIVTVASGATPGLASLRHLHRPATKLTCGLITPTQLAKLTGLSVSKPTTVVAGSTTTCTYNAKLGEVILQYVTGYSTAAYNANVVQFKLHSEKPTPLAGYGDHAVELTLGKSPAGISLIKGKTGFSVSAVLPLSKLEAVSKAVLPSL